MRIRSQTKSNKEIIFGDPNQKIVALTEQGQAGKGQDLALRHNGPEASRQAAMEGHNSPIAGSWLQAILSETSHKLLSMLQLASAELREERRKVDGKNVRSIDRRLFISDASGSSADMLLAHSSPHGHAAWARHNAERELNQLKADRGGIKRRALEPSITRTAAVTSVVMIVEGIAGFVLFADISNGPIEAAIYSGLATATTLAAGGTIGAAARHAFHGPLVTSVVQRIKRGIAWFGVVGGTLALVGSALLIGHYRDDVAAAAVSDNAPVPKLSLAHLTPDAWFDFQTLQGLLMTGISVVCGLIAAWKAYSGFSDPIPGYTRTQRAFNRAANELLEREDDLREAATAIHASHVAALQERIETDASTVHLVRESADKADIVMSQYAGATLDTIDTHNTAVRICQEAYQQIRPDLPDYFKRAYLSAADVTALPDHALRIRARADELDAAHEGNLSTAIGIRMDLTELRAKVSRRITAASQIAGGHDHRDSTYAATDMLGGEL